MHAINFNFCFISAPQYWIFLIIFVVLSFVAFWFLCCCYGAAIDILQRRQLQRDAEARRRAGIAYNFLRGPWNDDDEDDIQLQRIQVNRHHTPTPRPPPNNQQSEHINPLLDPRLMQDTFV